MNRRDLFKRLLALPAVAALAPLLPKPPTIDELTLEAARAHMRMKMALDLYNSSPKLISRQDITDILFDGMKLEGSYKGIPLYSSPDVPKDTFYVLDRDRIIKGPLWRWNEDS